MKAEELLESWVEKIHKMRPFEDKWKFFKYGVKGDFLKIRATINPNNEKPKKNEIEAFIGICDNRINRLKNSTTELVTSIGAIIAVLAVFLIRYSEKSHFLILSIFLLISVTVLIVALAYYRAQMYAWYAVKEGVLLEKKEKND
jgi:multisubunit Na+/H+ antiporter MnhG subunit